MLTANAKETTMTDQREIDLLGRIYNAQERSDAEAAEMLYEELDALRETMEEERQAADDLVTVVLGE
jgi:hypothetical protein